MDDWMDGRMNDETDGWNDASWRPLLYVIWLFNDNNYSKFNISHTLG